MALVKPYVFQLVGFKNSGKTTFIVQLIAQLSAQGEKVVTIKHHGHGGKPSVVEETDSALHINAGAQASLVDGGGRLVLQTEGTEWSLKEKIAFMSMMNPDIILIEGYKNEKYPKAVFIRDQNDLALLSELNNIELLLLKELPEDDCPQRSFQRDDPNAVQWLTEFLMKKIKIR